MRPWPLCLLALLTRRGRVALLLPLLWGLFACGQYVQASPSPYGGAAVTIAPGAAPVRVEAENYDLGGEGVAFHDYDNGGQTGYRADNIGVVAQGSTGQSTISVTPSNGFNGSVALTASGLPSGVTASFSPQSTTTTNTLTLTAGGTAATGTATVTITGNGGGLTRTTTLNLTVTAAANQAPTVATPASASPNPVTGATTALSALGADDGGEAALTYTWSATGPAPVTFSANGTNAAKNTTATFTQAGAYTLQVVIADAQGLTATSTVSVTVSQTTTTITVSPASASVPTGGTQQFTASATDQFGNALSPQPAFTWTVSGGGTIDGSGLFTATTSSGTYTVTATAAGGKSGNASVSTGLAAPTNLTAVSTGSGKITLYWDGTSSATGYDVYRGTVAGGEDYAHPVNGSMHVTSTSYPGGSTYTFTDTGLTDGTEYFYTVVAVNGTSQSPPSDEDSDLADPNAVPWGSTNPSDVLNAVRSAYASGSVPVQGSLRVAGPDGQIYEDGQTQVLPPDGQLITGTNQFVLSDGDQITLNNDTPSPATSPIASPPSMSPQVITTFGNSHSGPYRRVRTAPSYIGGTGLFYLPPIGYRGLGVNTDSLDLLLGGNSSGGGKTVDAGLLYVISRKTGLPTGWRPYLKTSPAKRIIVCFPRGSNVFDDDQYVDVAYIARPENTGRGSKGLPCLVQIQDLDGTQSQSLAAYIGYRYNESVTIKRTISIAQDLRDPTVSGVGYKKTGSYLTGLSWGQGQLILPGGGTTAWSGGTSPEDGSFPGKGGIVDWFETSPYVAEDNIKIDLR